MSFSERGCGCIVIIGVLSVISAISKCNDKHSSAPKVSQPSTGQVSGSSRYESSSPPAIPTIEEPYGQLQSGGVVGASAALKMTNNMSKPAYVKVYDSNRNVRATIYLRAGESYELGVNPDSYLIKYVTGPGSEWRGTTHYFGSSSSFHADREAAYIGSNQRLSVTFFTRMSRGGYSGSTAKIDEEDF